MISAHDTWHNEDTKFCHQIWDKILPKLLLEFKFGFEYIQSLTTNTPNFHGSISNPGFTGCVEAKRVSRGMLRDMLHTELTRSKITNRSYKCKDHFKYGTKWSYKFQ